MTELTQAERAAAIAALRQYVTKWKGSARRPTAAFYAETRALRKLRGGAGV